MKKIITPLKIFVLISVFFVSSVVPNPSVFSKTVISEEEFVKLADENLLKQIASLTLRKIFDSYSKGNYSSVMKYIADDYSNDRGFRKADFAVSIREDHNLVENIRLVLNGIDSVEVQRGNPLLITVQYRWTREITDRDSGKIILTRSSGSSATFRIQPRQIVVANNKTGFSLFKSAHADITQGAEDALEGYGVRRGEGSVGVDGKTIDLDSRTIPNQPGTNLNTPTISGRSGNDAINNQGNTNQGIDSGSSSAVSTKGRIDIAKALGALLNVPEDGLELSQNPIGQIGIRGSYGNDAIGFNPSIKYNEDIDGGSSQGFGTTGIELIQDSGDSAYAIANTAKFGDGTLDVFNSFVFDPKLGTKSGPFDIRLSYEPGDNVGIRQSFSFSAGGGSIFIDFATLQLKFAPVSSVPNEVAGTFLASGTPSIFPSPSSNTDLYIAKNNGSSAFDDLASRLISVNIAQEFVRSAGTQLAPGNNILLFEEGTQTLALLNVERVNSPNVEVTAFVTQRA